MKRIGALNILLFLAAISVIIGQSVRIQSGATVQSGITLGGSAVAAAAMFQGFDPQSNEPPSTGLAESDTRNSHPVLDFDTAADECAVFTFVLAEDYGGGSVDVQLQFTTTAAGGSNVALLTDFERILAGTLDIDADSFDTTAICVLTSSNSTSGITVISTHTHTSGEIDGLLAGELGRLRVCRDIDGASCGSDVQAGDVELVSVTIDEV